MDVVVPSHRELEGSGEGAVLHGDGGDVDFLDQTGVGNDLLGIHHVHQGLADGDLLHARHIESVHVFPPAEQGQRNRDKNLPCLQKRALDNVTLLARSITVREGLTWSFGPCTDDLRWRRRRAWRDPGKWDLREPATYLCGKGKGQVLISQRLNNRTKNTYTLDSWYIPFEPGIKHGFEHGLVEETVTHPFGDDDVDLLDPFGQGDFFHLAFDQLDRVFEMIGLIRMITK